MRSRLPISDSPSTLSSVATRIQNREGGLHHLSPLMRRWTRAWGLPGLEHAVDLSFSTRLSRSLGRCSPSTGRIVLSASLRSQSGARVADALCHELAHVAAYILYGGAARAHGHEWAQLVRDAGLTPHARREGRCVDEAVREPTRPRGSVYEHRCPVCQTVRVARRPVTGWRCAECSAAGLSGHMVVTRRASL